MKSPGCRDEQHSSCKGSAQPDAPNVREKRRAPTSPSATYRRGVSSGTGLFRTLARQSWQGASLLLFLGLLILSAACSCSSPPEVHYYVLNLRPPTERVASQKTGLVLGIQPFRIDPVYGDRRLVYRRSAYEVAYYHYHQWATPLDEQVTALLGRYLKDSGLFGDVVVYPSRTAADLLLEGNIREFGEEDGPEGWLAVVDLDLKLRDARTDRLVWDNRLRQQVPVRTKTPLGVVEALSRALEEVAAEIARSMRDTIAIGFVPKHTP